MTSFKLFLLFLALWTVSLADDNAQNPGNTTSHPQKNNVTAANITISPEPRQLQNISFTLSSDMIQRALYVLIGITAIGVLYFLVRAVRQKKSTVQRRKYGLLSNYDDTMEMSHLESDEEDNTVYEARSLRR